MLTKLHNEAVFLPLTRKKNIAVVNDRVSGFRFGAMEFDIPIHELYPTPLPKPPEPEPFPVGGIVGIVVGAVALLAALSCVGFMISREKRGEPLFMKIPEPTDLTSPVAPPPDRVLAAGIASGFGSGQVGTVSTKMNDIGEA